MECATWVWYIFSLAGPGCGPVCVISALWGRLFCALALLLLGTLRYEDGKARTGTAVDAGNFCGSRCVVKNKMLKMRIFSKDGDDNNSNFVKAIPLTETVTSFRL